MQRVVFRVDESIQVGFGHMSRCRALADPLVQTGVTVSFCCRSVRPTTRLALEMLGVTVIDLVDEKAFLAQDFRGSIVVVDGYHFDTDFWQQLISARPSRTVCIDDFRQVPYLADIVVCYNEGVKAEQFDLTSNTRLFLGGRYLMLRPEIMAAAPLADSRPPRHALMIAAGGTRQELWIARMLSHLSRVEPGVPLWVLTGRDLSSVKVLHQSRLGRSQVRFFSGLGAPAMFRLYRQALCLFTPASTLMLEAFSAGCPLVSGWIADNQRNSLQFYDSEGLVVNVGDLHQVSLTTLTLAYRKARSHSGRMVCRQRAYIEDSKSGINEIVQAILAVA